MEKIKKINTLHKVKFYPLKLMTAFWSISAAPTADKIELLGKFRNGNGH